MIRINQNFSTSTQIIEFTARGLRFVCAVGSYPETHFTADEKDVNIPGGKFVVLVNWDICVRLKEPFKDKNYPTARIAEALENSSDTFMPQDRDEQWKIAREIAKAIEPYLKDGEKN